ncbi:MAG TPA: cobalamin-independent methionine synthase II family protein [Burkholderiales bacterium]|nr:cobalamin-independent methionine synthase II family protein [Burkholderiales bacterium]
MSRILTTHVGSLPRPHALLDAMKAKLAGNAPPDYESRVRQTVAECVREQIEAGIDIVSDGEQSKPGFFSYVRDRLAGFEPKADRKVEIFPAEVRAFPEYYEQYFKEAMLGGAIARFAPLVCTGPVSYSALEPLRRDIDNLKAAMTAANAKTAFMPAIAPSGVGSNEYYRSDEEYLHAVGAAMRTEYRAIVDAGLLLQIDDPFLCDVLVDPRIEPRDRRRLASLHVEVVNESIRGIPEEKVRFHTCYGINEGPRIHEAPMKEVARYMLRIKAGAYSFENANVRHEHEYHIWDDLELPDGRKLIPGMLLHACNIVEHPELIAERLVRFADRVGRDSVIAGTDCGFSSQASYRTEVHPTVVWAKFQALSEGARIASRRLWPATRRVRPARA